MHRRPEEAAWDKGYLNVRNGDKIAKKVNIFSRCCQRVLRSSDVMCLCVCVCVYVCVCVCGVWCVCVCWCVVCVSECVCKCVCVVCVCVCVCIHTQKSCMCKPNHNNVPWQ